MKPKTAAQLWESLEDHRMPTPHDLKYLSGLLDADIHRLTTLWPALPSSVRHDLVNSLTDMTEADFEMDFSALFRIALRDADPEIRATAIEGLMGDEDVRLVAQFCKILTDDAAITPRVKAAQALGQFILLGELQKIRPRPFDMARHALHQAYHNPAEPLEVKRRALESLAYTALDGVGDMIAGAYAHSETKMQISAVFAMGRSADKRWADIVRRELTSSWPEMRYEAARSCGELELREAVPDLLELLEDVDTEVQQVTLWALGQIGGDLARSALARYSRSEDEALSQAAREALDELEFFHGDLGSFFGPPTEFVGESDVGWEDAGLSEEDWEDLAVLLEDDEGEDDENDKGEDDEEDAAEDGAW